MPRPGCFSYRFEEGTERAPAGAPCAPTARPLHLLVQALLARGPPPPPVAAPPSAARDAFLGEILDCSVLERFILRPLPDAVPPRTRVSLELGAPLLHSARMTTAVSKADLAAWLQGFPLI